MGYDPKELIRVRNLDELRAGMTVVVKACCLCGRTHACILVRPDVAEEHSHACEGIISCMEPCWFISQSCVSRKDHESWCFGQTIRDRRLFRLRPPEDEASPYLAVAAPRDRRPALLIPLRQLAREGKIEP